MRNSSLILNLHCGHCFPSFLLDLTARYAASFCVKGQASSVSILCSNHTRLEDLMLTSPSLISLSEKAAKAAAKGDGSSKGTTTTASSTNGGASSTGTPMTNMSANTSVENLDMKKLSLATERNASGVLSSDKQSRDVHIDNFTMSFHGRLLVDGASIVLNYGQR